MAGTPRFAIVGGRVIPVAGAPFEDGVVLIADGRIEAAGRDLRVPEGVERVDAAGKVVLPGLVDAHTWACTPRATAGPARTPTS